MYAAPLPLAYGEPRTKGPFPLGRVGLLGAHPRHHGWDSYAFGYRLRLCVQDGAAVAIRGTHRGMRCRRYDASGSGQEAQMRGAFSV